MPAAGYSLVELVTVTALIATISAVAFPGILATVDDSRAVGATRYLSSRLQHARMESVMRSANVGLKVAGAPDGYTYTTYVDGNGNGIRTSDIQHGIDPAIRPPERLRDLFYGIDFGLLPGLPPVEPGAPPPGVDPVKLGASSILSFTPIGTSSSGSLYILSPGGAQYVIRIFGESGKTRMLRFDPRARRWKPL